jgi:hypothetical protein
MSDATTISTGETQLFTKAPGESRFGNISIRAWLALMTTATVCSLVVMGKQIDANFTAQWGMILAFYFAQREKPKQPA